MVFYWFYLLFLQALLFPFSDGVVTLTSSAQGALCPREEVTLTCTVTGGFILEWNSPAFNPEIRYIGNDPVGIPTVRGIFTTTLISTILTPTPSLFDFTSTLRVTATSEAMLNGTVITCTDQLNPMSTTLTLAGPPSPPVNVTPSNQQYSRSNVSILLQWDPPVDNGGTSVDNYTITVTGPNMQELTSNGTTATITVVYNEMYTVNIRTNNCAGSSSDNAAADILEAGCGGPSTPGNGSLVQFVSAELGAVITYECSPGFIPRAPQMSVCAQNRSWDPDPAQLLCQEPPPDMTSPTQPTTPPLTSGFSPTSGSTPTTSISNTTSPVPQVQPWLVPVVVIVTCVLVIVSVIVIIIGVVVGLKRYSGGPFKREKLNSSHPSNQIELQSREEPPISVQPSNSVEPNGAEYSVARAPQATKNGAEYSVARAPQATKIPPGLMYAELGPNSQEPKIQRPPSGDNVGVQYSSVLHGEAAIKNAVHPADKSLDLDNLLVQLQNVPSSKWYQLGEGLGVPAESLNKITTSFPSAPNQCKLEMLDLWLRNRTREGQAKWSEVAEALTRIQEHKLANELMGVYTTGTLPILVDMRSLPRSPGLMDDPPPPVPPKYFPEQDEEFPPPPKIPEYVGPHQTRAVAPPRPPKSSPLPPRPPKSSQEATSFPPRPPKTDQELPPRPPKANQELPPHPPKTNPEGTVLPPRPAKPHQQSAQKPGPVAPPRPPKSHSRGPPSDAPPRPPKPGSSYTTEY